MRCAAHGFARCLLLGLLAAACSGRSAGRTTEGAGDARTLTLRGSDTMVVLAQRWAEELMREHSELRVQVSGGGTGTGIAALVHGNTDLATASRPMQDAERAAVRARRHAEVHEYPVALDAIAIYVHSANPVRSLTMQQLALIFRGRITRWSELGGPDRRIILYSRENNSGTYAYFKERVLEDLDFAASAQTLPGTAAVIHAVSSDRYSIGYGGIGYGRGVRAVPISRDAEHAPCAPTLEGATSGDYPLARQLFLYTAGAPTGPAARFIELARSPRGQGLVERTGFYPLPAAPRRAHRDSAAAPVAPGAQAARVAPPREADAPLARLR